MTPELDPHHPDRVVADLPARLRAFADAGVLAAADVHTARRLAALTGCTDDDATLAAAFAVRAPRYGHVFAQLDQLAGTVTDEDGRSVEVDPAIWPDDVDAWVAAVAASPLIGADGPLHLDGRRLYLDRYWRFEHRVAASLRTRGGTDGSSLVVTRQAWRALEALVEGNAEQLAAARAALDRRLTVVAGGPGTGKTATIATIVAVARDHVRRPDGTPLRVAVAAPTGKAAARLGEAMRQAAARMDDRHVDPHVLDDVVPTTLHRLLGATRNRTRFRHDADDPLAVDLVVIDEVSMVPLGMLARLLDAVPVDAHLVLVGDPDQLAAVEAGTVLGDLVAAADTGPLAGTATTLATGYRFAGPIGEFAAAVRHGDAQTALACAAVDPPDLADVPVALVVPDRPGEWPSGTGPLEPVRRLVVEAARQTVAHALRGEVAQALAATLTSKVLCAHRRGPEGVAVWNAAIEGWVHQMPAWRRPEWYPGRPIIVTDNDYDLGVFNGDIGVVVRQDGVLRVGVDGRRGRPIAVQRLDGVQTVHAMTVHKSQGSQFERVVVVLPSERSPILTRELLYTAVTRARLGVVVVGSPEVLADAISRGVSRASALPERLSASG